MIQMSTYKFVFKVFIIDKFWFFCNLQKYILYMNL